MGRTTAFRSLILATAVVASGSLVSADWNEGLTAFNAGNYQVAAEHFAEITRTNPSWPGGYYMLGRCQSELDQGTEAIESLRKAYDLDASDANTVIALSRELMSGDFFAETLDILESTTVGELPPALRSEAAALLAAAMLGKDDAQGAIGILQERLREDGANPALFRILGKAQAATGDRESAFQSFSKAFELNPDELSGEAATRTALSLAGAALEADQKTEWYRHALAIGSRLATAFPKAEYDLLTGQAALGAEDFEAAERWFRAALSKDENDPETRYLQGRSLAGLGREDEAYDAFSAALTEGPDDELTRRIHGRMGQIAACRLDLETATDHYRSARQADRAQEIESLATQFAGALAQLEKLRATVDEIQQMERDLAELGDAQGVTAMRERAAAERSKIDEIEDNLEAVRSALCR